MAVSRIPTRILVIIACAFVATTLAFLGAAVASFAVTTDIDRQTSDLLHNALPSVRELSRARTSLRKLRESVIEIALAPPPRSTSNLDADRKDLEDALVREAATPWYGGERVLYEEQVRPALDDLDAGVRDLQGFADAPQDDPALRSAIGRLREAGNRTDAALVSLSDLNHDQAFAAAGQIVTNRQEAARVSLYLDVGATLVAATAAALAIVFTRRFAKVMRRNAELESERAEQLDLFAQRVAHDLMSPLAAVSLSLDTLLRRHRDEETARTVDRAQGVLQRSRRMVDGIYAFAQSHAEPSRDAVTPLRAAVLDAAGTLRTLDGQRCPDLVVEPFEDVSVRMDRGMLDVVLTNLLSNASKFTSDAPVRRVTVRARVQQSRVRIEVQDTGPGVPDGTVDTIFEPYKRAFRSAHSGLGLGLATVKRIVVGHGGGVGVRNAPSGGAVFWFEVPIVPSAAGAGADARQVTSFCAGPRASWRVP